jgi:hypothetical protein
LALKRCAALDSDAENMDPVLFKQITKRKRSSEGDEPSKEFLKPTKTSRISLIATKSEIARGVSAPLGTQISRPSTPPSRPLGKPAGRSPTSKVRRPFGRHSTGHSARFEPPSKRTSCCAPFSVATALSGKKMSSPARSKPDSWFFDIHADTEQEEMTNLMQHSTGILDISDDEDRAKVDERGKENIPPNELGVGNPGLLSSTAAVSRKNMMTGEPRTPLGELNSGDYYADGCDALSFAVVYEELEDEKEKIPQFPHFESMTPSRSRTQSEMLSLSTISSLLGTGTGDEITKTIPEAAMTTSDPTNADFEIWESGSAVEEAANAVA